MNVKEDKPKNSNGYRRNNELRRSNNDKDNSSKKMKRRRRKRKKKTRRRKMKMKMMKKMKDNKITHRNLKKGNNRGSNSTENHSNLMILEVY